MIAAAKAMDVQQVDSLKALKTILGSINDPADRDKVFRAIVKRLVSLHQENTISEKDLVALLRYLYSAHAADQISTTLDKALKEKVMTKLTADLSYV